MVLDLFVNFCILFTFALVMFWFTRLQKQSKVPLLLKRPGYSIGVLAGIFGIVLMLKSIHVGPTIIIDGRMALLALSGLFGGPIAPVISGIMMGSARIVLNDVTLHSIVAGANTMLVGIVIGIIALRIPITFKNAWKYFAYTTIQTMIVIGYLSAMGEFVAGRGLVFAVYSILSFLVVYVILKKMNDLSQEIDKMEHFSETDYLTGLANNRKFQELFTTWTESKPIFYLAVLDIDYFKRINDAYGHPIGDVVLIELARRLERTSEEFGGKVARIGGEEFAVLIPVATAREAKAYAEKLRQAIEALPFITDDRTAIPVTISAGVANYPQDAKIMAELYTKADNELYKAKEQGRNRVSIAQLKENPVY